MLDIGKEIRKIREEASVDRLVLAYNSKVGLTTLYNIERGATIPRIDTVMAILDELGYELILVKKPSV